MSHFGIGVYHTKTRENIGTLWRAAHLYGASHIFTIGARYQRQVTDTSKAWRNIPLINYPDWDAFQEARAFDVPLIGVELADRAVPLGRYVHRPLATYLLGAEDHGLPPRVMDACQDIVQIETAQAWSMNVAMAGSLVMYSRHLQRQLVTA